VPFNSYEFIFLFLPVTLAGYFLLGRFSRGWALRWIALTSLAFYAWWRPVNVIIILPSVLVNYTLGRLLLRLRERDKRMAQGVLVAGIIFNVVFLGYFKYTNFLAGVANDVAGTSFVLERIILPLGISFITFQKIAFLVDVHAGRIDAFTFEDYCLFVLFFPQLISGPIVHYRELMPQFQRVTARFDREDIAIGLTLFGFGLAKKVFLADSIAPFVTPLYDRAAAGDPLSLLPSWLGAVGFTLQVYFDFSGYTDMALGLARFFGVRLPPNFDSPLRATSIIDFWLRWHMTLTRFLTAYVYNPLTLALTRRRVASGRPPLSAGRASVGGFVALLMVPTIITMLLSGFWHGAGYLFILWGLLHGMYLCVNHAWRMLAPRKWRETRADGAMVKPIGFLLTFVGVVVGMVLFRSSTVAAALEMLRGMVGQNGMDLPTSIFARLGPLAALAGRLGVTAGPEVGVPLIGLLKWTLLLGFIALACPNTLQLLSHFEPALGVRPGKGHGWHGWEERMAWRPTLAWALVASIIAALGVVRLGGRSEFLYWQF
jgi:D-alanyl-lipoteichoic acid acyltransferase DltB (MBOAT superfamily)